MERVSVFARTFLQSTRLVTTATGWAKTLRERGRLGVHLQVHWPGAQPQSAQVHPEFPQPPMLTGDIFVVELCVGKGVVKGGV